MADFLTFDQAMQLFGTVGNKFQDLNGACIYKGAIAFENLPAPVAERNGFGYTITNEFTTDSRFVVGAGHEYSANTKVMVVPISGNPVTYGYDVFSVSVDEANIIAPAFDETTAYSKGDVVIYDGKLYVANKDTSAGEFDPDSFTSTSLADLIEKNEPEVQGEQLIIGG